MEPLQAWFVVKPIWTYPCYYLVVACVVSRRRYVADFILGRSVDLDVLTLRSAVGGVCVANVGTQLRGGVLSERRQDCLGRRCNVHVVCAHATWRWLSRRIASAREYDVDLVLVSSMYSARNAKIWRAHQGREPPMGWVSSRVLRAAQAWVPRLLVVFANGWQRSPRSRRRALQVERRLRHVGSWRERYVDCALRRVWEGCHGSVAGNDLGKRSLADRIGRHAKPA